jgi:hypothetical protein
MNYLLTATREHVSTPPNRLVVGGGGCYRGLDGHCLGHFWIYNYFHYKRNTEIDLTPVG